jgi:hypothetical protein
MKLAEALLLRSDIQKDLAWVKEQLAKGARVQEGEKPAEDPEELIERAEKRAGELVTLLVRINVANLKHRDPAGRTLTDLLAQRDALKLKHSIFTSAYAEATAVEERYGRSEIRWQRTFDMSAMRQRIGRISTELRELNGGIQQLNWQIDIEDI